MPALRNMLSSKHHWVKPLCSRLTPTKAVKAKNHGLTKSGLEEMPSSSDKRMKVPANSRTYCQEVMDKILRKK